MCWPLTRQVTLIFKTGHAFSSSFYKFCGLLVSRKKTFVLEHIWHWKLKRFGFDFNICLDSGQTVRKVCKITGFFCKILLNSVDSKVCVGLSHHTVCKIGLMKKQFRQAGLSRCLLLLKKRSCRPAVCKIGLMKKQFRPSVHNRSLLVATYKVVLSACRCRVQVR